MHAWNRTKGLCRRKAILTLFGAALLLMSSGTLDPARADLRLRARVETPSLRIRIGSGPHHSYARFAYDSQVGHRYYRRSVRRPRLRLRYESHGEHYRLDRQDRRVAKRLARWTGYSRREILDLRRDGYRWFEIGRILDIRADTIRAALGPRGHRKRHLRSWHDDD